MRVADFRNAFTVQARELERAFELLQQMQQQRVLPDGPTFSTLISACCRGRQLERAYDVLELMAQAGT